MRVPRRGQALSPGFVSRHKKKRDTLMRVPFAVCASLSPLERGVGINVNGRLIHASDASRRSAVGMDCFALGQHRQAVTRSAGHLADDCHVVVI